MKKLYNIKFVVDEIIEGEDELEAELKFMELMSLMSTGEKFSCMETVCLDDNKEELCLNQQK